MESGLKTNFTATVKSSIRMGIYIEASMSTAKGQARESIISVRDLDLKDSSKTTKWSKEQSTTQMAPFMREVSQQMPRDMEEGVICMAMERPTKVSGRETRNMATAVFQLRTIFMRVSGSRA